MMRPCAIKTAPATGCLDFHTLTLSDVPAILPMLRQATTRTCDFSVGGLLMWVDYFRYSISIVADTLFVMGVREDDLDVTAFSLPVGALPLSESIALLRSFCEAHNIPLVLSAVPEEAIPALQALGAREITPLADWSDYLYEAQAMATFAGKHLNKKRNHLNRFRADNPQAVVEPLTAANLPAVKAFFEAQHMRADKGIMADYERLAVMDVLKRPELYGFEGAVVSTPEHGVVAFTMGEAIGDTLYVHIEKMDHDVTGSGESVAHGFAAMMLERHPELRYVNREDDAGDPGLRQAKMAYAPCAILQKYNVTF